MKTFFWKAIGLFFLPILWLLSSVVYQIYVTNPIGNGYVKFELARMEDHGLFFIGPSTFHSRIDTKLISESLSVPVHNISFDGMNSMEYAAIARKIESQAKHGVIIIAGQDMSASVPGFHCCWASSDPNIFDYGLQSEYYRTCGTFDAVTGVIAGFTPLEETTPYLGWDTEAGISDSTLLQFRQMFNAMEPLRRSDFFEVISRANDSNFSRLLVVPANGRFRRCPDPFDSTMCKQFMDDSWLDKSLWKDGAHTSKLGTQKFNNLLLNWLIQNPQIQNYLHRSSVEKQV